MTEDKINAILAQHATLRANALSLIRRSSKEAKSLGELQAAIERITEFYEQAEIIAEEAFRSKESKK